MYQTWNYNARKGYRIKQNTEGNFFLINHKMPKITWAKYMVIDWKQDFICNTGMWCFSLCHVQTSEYI